jgi:hypothetical protein
VDYKDMLKGYIRQFLNKLNNANYCSIRFLYEKIEGQMYQKSDYNNQYANCEQDVLSNIRKWIPHEMTNKPGFIFTIFNYNILSQRLLEQHSYLYQSHNQNALDWKTRLYNIAGDIFKANPSILCCQVSEKIKSKANVIKVCPRKFIFKSKLFPSVNFSLLSLFRTQ